MNDSSETAWEKSWREKIYERVYNLGFENVSSFLAAHPSLPLYQVARKLGPHVAAVQLIRLSFKEVQTREDFELSARDLLSRVLRSNLRKGWKSGAHSIRMMAGARSEWLSALEFRTGFRNLRPTALAIWNELECVTPPVGWLPCDSDDRILIQAVSNGVAKSNVNLCGIEP
ncbi:MAG: hypothetical protein NXI28_08700 [bacterium]|nr:hypothetical protein [bacterium]|tara:strand:+ start:171 stop:686 length:516 start_codon:yes stop_codon:yes gene_type:complete